jgi:hypothetical protein
MKMSKGPTTFPVYIIISEEVIQQDSQSIDKGQPNPQYTAWNKMRKKVHAGQIRRRLEWSSQFADGNLFIFQFLHFPNLTKKTKTMVSRISGSIDFVFFVSEKKGGCYKMGNTAQCPSCGEQFYLGFDTIDYNRVVNGGLCRRCASERRDAKGLRPGMKVECEFGIGTIVEISHGVESLLFHVKIHQWYMTPAEILGPTQTFYTKKGIIKRPPTQEDFGEVILLEEHEVWAY